MEAEIALGALLRRFPDFRASVDDIEWRRSTVLRGPRTLPVHL
jgi:cytochrome P450